MKAEDTVRDLIDLIEPPYHSACLQIFNDNLDLFRKSPGSRFLHQAWPGGYLDHVADVMKCCQLSYWHLSAWRQFPFSLSDALLVCFLHDLEKPWKYEGGVQMDSKQKRKAYRQREVEKYGITLTAEQQNGLDYVEGELDDYDPHRRVMGPLAGFCHSCDIMSARVWPEFRNV